uniref:Uncharacterized protein n=1 Tax=Anguilla anguilla TaxID=7936 RepID=A0A0E9WI27_ANGAN
MQEKVLIGIQASNLNQKKGKPTQGLSVLEPLGKVTLSGLSLCGQVSDWLKQRNLWLYPFLAERSSYCQALLSSLVVALGCPS